MERPFGMGAQPLGSVDEILDNAVPVIEDNAVTNPGPARPSVLSAPVMNPAVITDVIGATPQRSDNRLGYRNK